MKKKCVCLFLLNILLIFTYSAIGAVRTSEIDRVRNKEILNQSDFEVIDQFLQEAILEIARTRDFTNISSKRADIVTRRNSTVPGAQGQYRQRFIQSAVKYLQQALNELNTRTDPGNRFTVKLNLLILINDLQSLEASELVLDEINSDTQAIRYWAVHCLTNEGVTRELSEAETEDLRLAIQITERFKELIETCDINTLRLITDFASRLTIRQGEELLIAIADKRISQYEDWTVRNELFDSKLLKLLYSKISSEGSTNQAIARRFAQLYAYGLQRYAKGKDIISSSSKHELASMLIEIENVCISELLLPSSVIKRSIEKDLMTVYSQEYQDLFGSEGNAGEVTEKLGIDYGTKEDGSKRLTPLMLPDPPGQ